MPSTGTENKQTGSFYTPSWCVEMMMQIASFDERFLARPTAFKVIDPACGDGAMLVCVCDQMIRLMRLQEFTDADIAQVVLGSVYGIELDDDEAQKARENVCGAAKEQGISIIPEDVKIFTGDAFDIATDLYGSFDFVIGNPPYVRIHNLEEKPDSSYIEGMCDLYLGFYDLGQRLLCDGGRLVYIAPSSWMTSRAGRSMRKDLRQKQAIRSILDFKHYQVFDNATAYTAIVVIDKDEQDEIEIYDFNENDKTYAFAGHISQDDCWIEDGFYAESCDTLCDILKFNTTALPQDVRERIEAISVRNGYATMRDETYISNAPRFKRSAHEIKVIKASKAQEMYGIYPYTEDGSLIPIEDIKVECEKIYLLLAEDKENLLKRNKVDYTKWWGYGRSQGIRDTYRDKISIQTIVRPDKEILIHSAPAGTGVFGGVYVIGLDEEDLQAAISDDAFWVYVKALAKYKSGGYYALGGKELEKYLRWWTCSR